jgi:TonB family protein
MEHEFVQSGLQPTITSEDRRLLATETKHPEKILSAKKLDAPLKPVSQRGPIFPSAMRDRMDRGEAKLEILIDEEGKVRLPRIVEATDPAFGYAAIQAVVDWRFEPPIAGGKAVVVRVQVPFSFKEETQGTKPKPAPAPTIDQTTLDSAIPAEKQP